jgi:hypothetical protein
LRGDDDDDRHPTVADPKREKPGDRGAGPPKTGYRPGRKSGISGRDEEGWRLTLAAVVTAVRSSQEIGLVAGVSRESELPL